MFWKLLTIINLLTILTTVNGLFGMSKTNKYKSLNHEQIAPIITDESIIRAVEVDWIEQRIDNFDPSNHETFMMRYYKNADYFQEGGPIFIMVGGEWTITPGWLMTGHMFDMARDMEGYMYYTEHRYYGESLPTEDASVENLRYLTIDQALADLAHFIVEIKKDPMLANAPVIICGRSYSATMVAWFHKKYPHLSDGAWSSSAPLLAQVDFIEYKEVVGAAVLSVGGWDCFNRIENAFRIMEEMIERGEYDVINEKYQLCVPFHDEDDIWIFFSTLTEVISTFVQYHLPGDIEGMCAGIMNPEAESDFDGFAEWIVPLITDGECFDTHFESAVEFFSDTNWESIVAYTGYRQWIYQTCAEFGWYQTSGSRFQPFGSSFPVELYYRLCNAIYGPAFTNETMHSNTYRINVLYGGLRLDVTNVIFTHGMLDPWRPMGIQHDLNHQSPTIVIPGASHRADMYSISERDSPAMLQAKQLIQHHISHFISQAQGDPTPF